jgi:Skp family chaperone for outer membrane proteins
MTDWLKRNWLKVLIGIVVFILIYSAVDSAIARAAYKKDIKASNKEIASLKRDMKESDTRADAAVVRARIAEEEARVERAEKEKHKARAARVEEEKRELRSKIAALPPTQVVVHTVEILRVDPKEIMLQPQGVLFTLVAARRNLEFLEAFTLVKKQYGELQISLAKSEASEAKLMEAGREKDKAITEKDGQLANWVKAEIEWENKFNLSEQRNKRARAKGRKEGGIAGAIIGGVIGFFLGK